MGIGLWLHDVKCATAVVAQDGSGDFNGTTGEVIQNALNYVGNKGGGIVFVKQGDYTLEPINYIEGWGYVCLLVPNYVELVCENGAKFITSPAGKTSTRIDGIGLKAKQDGEDAYNVKLKNIWLDMTAIQGGGRIGDGIGLGVSSPNYGYECKAENIYVKGAPHYGVSVGRMYRASLRNIYGEANGRGALYMGQAFYCNVDGLWGWDSFGDDSVSPPEGFGAFLGDGSSRLNLKNIHTWNNAYAGLNINGLDTLNIDNLVCRDEIKCIQMLSGGPFNVNIANFILDTKERGQHAVYIKTATRNISSINFVNGMVSTGHIEIVDGGYNLIGIRFNNIDFINVDHILKDESGKVRGLFLSNIKSESLYKEAIITNAQYFWLVHSYIRCCKEGDNLYDLIKFSGVHGWIEDNMLYGEYAPIYGINTDGANIVRIYRNDFFNCPNPINPAGSNLYIRQNRGYVTENSGTATFIGDGTTTSFNIAHGLATTPTYWSVEEASSAAGAAEISYATVTSSSITVNFKSAPASSSTVIVSWYAEV